MCLSKLCFVVENRATNSKCLASWGGIISVRRINVFNKRKNPQTAYSCTSFILRWSSPVKTLVHQLISHHKRVGWCVEYEWAYCWFGVGVCVRYKNIESCLHITSWSYGILLFSTILEEDHAWAHQDLLSNDLCENRMCVHQSGSETTTDHWKPESIPKGQT